MSDPQYTLRLSHRDYNIVLTSYELRRAEIIKEGNRPVSMNKFLTGLIMESLERRYGDGS